MDELFHEYKIDGGNDAEESCRMVPMECLMLKKNVCYDGKNEQRNALLDNFQLYQRERPAIADKADAVGWHLAAVFKKGDNPGKEDDADEWPIRRHPRLLQLQMPVPGKRHKDVA